ncbi:MAG: TonB family protein [Gemmatimonadaceae bacterium]
MFSTLLESKAQKDRNTGGAILSGVIHAGFIVLAVFATAHATTELEKPKEEEIDFFEAPKPKEPPPPEKPPPPPPDQPVVPPPPKGFQVLTAPVEIPDVIPDVDLTKQVTNEADFSGIGVEGGVASGVVGGEGPVTDQPYFEFQVEKPAILAPGQGLPSSAYPDILRNARVEGTVLAQFVVGTNGRADMSTFKVLKSDHDLFTRAVKRHLPDMRFLPAETGGRKVKMWVQQPFTFNLQS